MAIGGVPLAMAYKAVNTLDSMIGHADQRYFYFGKAAARLDDVANYLPSRLTALAIATAAGWKAMRAARPPCAFGGVMAESTRAPMPANLKAQWRALCASVWAARIPTQVSASSAPLLGAEFEQPKLHHAKQAIRLVTAVSLLSAVAAIAVRSFKK